MATNADFRGAAAVAGYGTGVLRSALIISRCEEEDAGREGIVSGAESVSTTIGCCATVLGPGPAIAFGLTGDTVRGRPDVDRRLSAAAFCMALSCVSSSVLSSRFAASCQHTPGRHWRWQRAHCLKFRICAFWRELNKRKLAAMRDQPAGPSTYCCHGTE